MLIFIIPTIVMISIFLYNLFDYGFDSDAVFYSIGGGGVSFLLTIILLVVAPLFYEEELIFMKESDIVALSSTTGQEGVFLLGSGSVKNKMKYHYALEDDRGVNLNSVSVENVYLKEDDNDTPNIKEYRKEAKNKLTRWFFRGSFDTEYHVTIPENTIKQEFNVDLEK